MRAYAGRAKKRQATMDRFLTPSDRISQNLTDVARVLGIGISITRMGTDGSVITGWKITS